MAWQQRGGDGGFIYESLNSQGSVWTGAAVQKAQGKKGRVSLMVLVTVRAEVEKGSTTAVEPCSLQPRSTSSLPLSPSIKVSVMVSLHSNHWRDFKTQASLPLVCRAHVR